jgi:hypothetical protein
LRGLPRWRKRPIPFGNQYPACLFDLLVSTEFQELKMTPKWITKILRDRSKKAKSKVDSLTKRLDDPSLTYRQRHQLDYEILCAQQQASHAALEVIHRK